MKVTLLSMEYPPNIYGGVGVHVGNMAAALSKLMDVEVRTKGAGGRGPRAGRRVQGAGGRGPGKGVVVRRYPAPGTRLPAPAFFRHPRMARLVFQSISAIL
jgi:hypothetical protein